MRLSTDTKNARLLAIATAIDANGGGTLTLYTGTIPASADDPVTDQVALAQLACPTPIADTITDGAMALAQITEVMALADGTATWGRLTDGANNPVADLDVGAHIAMPSPDLVAGMTVRIDTAVITEP